MTRPLIMLTCASSAAADASAPPYDRLGHTYARAVELGGGTPVLASNALSREAAEALLDRVGGVLLTGGSDVDPSEYGETPVNDTVVVDGPRDRFELEVARHAVARGVPVLGICRGIQSLNVALGGDLWQDLPTQRPSAIAHRQQEARDVGTHTVRVEPGSRLASVVGEEPFVVNSFHHQAVRTPAPSLTPVAWAEDGVIEALEGEGPAFVLGVQFHPEDMTGVSEKAVRLFAALVRAAGQR